MKILTWLDVRRIISRETKYGSELPEGVVRIRCFSDALEIGISGEENKDNAANALKEWFKDWYQEDESIINFGLDDNAALPVEFITEEQPCLKDINVRPFWEEIVYVESESEEEKQTPNIVKLPEAYTENPSLIAFYSFKGGVGRTLHLAAHIFALLDRAKEVKKPINILVIDADLEAPGLTYWNRAEKQQASVCFIDFLEVYHYSPMEREQTLDLFAREVKKSPKYEGNSTIYFLPACINDEQLLDTPILPEHLVRSLDGTWECGNAIHSLGKAIGADYVLIDLRAGLSEISSPIIFDPRIERFLVTTINEQSVIGTSLVLKQIGRVVVQEEKVNAENYYDPSLIISMLTPELKSLPDFENILVQFQSTYLQPEEENLYSTRLQIKETDFAQELLYITNWEDARLKLSQTTVMKVAREWADEQLGIPAQQESLPSNTTENQLLEEVYKLRDLCQQYEYAEQGRGEDLLVTEPLKNLATHFLDELPHIVSIGAKGAGKTFNYIQLSRFKYWENFLNHINTITHEETPQTKTHIFPFLESSNVKDNATTIINEARQEVISTLGDGVSDFRPSEYRDRIKQAITSQDWSEPEWTKFWISQMAKAIGINLETNNSNILDSLNNELKNKGLRIIFLFDGLEDIFPNIASDDRQKTALKALIDDLPKKLSEIRQSNIGVIIFLRRDFLRYTITQNLKQFESLYRPYDLSWDQDSFLRLVFWICKQSQIIGAKTVENIDSLSREELEDRLKELWGKKLGSDKSKEGYTCSWIFAALTDFNGRLQARDIVRFLYHAAAITVDKSKELQFEKWSASRLLPPKAIRRALEPCSQKKVEEAQEEYPAFKIWVEKLAGYHPNERKIPFAVEDFEMNRETVTMLEGMGVIYEDKQKEDAARFYIPEIFREGLGFSFSQRARPRVVVLKRKALSGKGMG
ncbi:MAG: ParA family protein [Calothrix sp. MO_167.B12]|nr:ParA family protein [Calothrix sp. MO_167.B12]